MKSLENKRSHESGLFAIHSHVLFSPWEVGFGSLDLSGVRA